MTEPTMTNNKTHEMTEIAHEAIQKNSESKILDWYIFCQDIIMENGSWPHELYEHVFELLSHTDVLVSDIATSVVKLLSDEWDSLTQIQKQHTLTKLESIYPKLKNHVACQCVAEILGMHDSSRESVRLLIEFSRLTEPHHRALAAFGLGMLACNVKDRSSKDCCIHRLQEMCADPATVVRQEVQQALNQINQAAND